MSSDTTVISAFYPIDSSVPMKSYKTAIKSLCKLPCTLVFFTTEALSLELHQWRRPFLNKTQIHVRSLDSFAMTCPKMMEFWKKQEEKRADSKTALHYAIAAIKQECVRIIVKQNPFHSQWFVWIDATIQRFPELQPYFNTFPSQINTLCEPGRIALLEIQSIPDSYWINRFEGQPVQYPFPKGILGAGCIVGDADAWNDLGEAYKDMLEDFALEGWFAGCDTDVLFAILMEKYTKKPFQLFFAKKYTSMEGIEWLSFPPMLSGTIDAEVDMRT